MSAGGHGRNKIYVSLADTGKNILWINYARYWRTRLPRTGVSRLGQRLRYAQRCVVIKVRFCEVGANLPSSSPQAQTNFAITGN
jgi:hypothetical protein